MTTSNARRLRIVAVAAAILSLAACSSGSDADTRGIAPAVEDAAVQDGEASSGEQNAPVEPGSSIIQTGSVSIEVSDVAPAVREVRDIAEALDGSIAFESQSESGEWGSPGASLTLRIPADHFTEAFESLTEVGSVVTQERSAEDVTAQHADLGARVAALEASVERLTDLMSESASTADLIEAESALSERQQELDGLRAQLSALEDQVDLATLSVSLSVKNTIPGGPETFWDGLLAGFGSLGTFAAGALIVLGVLTPWLLVAGIVAIAVVLIVRTARRGTGRRLTEPTRPQNGSESAEPTE